jgi:hypothetical protein
MRSCWASDLGACSSKISREHIVTKGLFIGDTVRVSGFSWLKGETKEIGLSSLTKKVLCVKHNSDLSEVDAAGQHAFDVFRQMRILSNKREKMRPQVWPVARRKIDGDLLERWLLKSLINLSHDGAYYVGSGSTTIGRASRELVEIAFGLRDFPERSGLSFAVRVGDQVSSDDTVGFLPLIREGKTILGCLAMFRGFRLVLNLAAEGFDGKLAPGVGSEWIGLQLNFRNKEIRVNDAGQLSQIVEITWKKRRRP